MGKPQQQPPDVAALIARARRNEGSAPRKHHLVPSSYLRRWAHAGLIRVTEVETGNSHVSSPKKAARITDFYRLEAAELDPRAIPPLLFETVLSEIEGSGKVVIDHLADQPNELSPEELAQFAWYLGFQFTRGSTHRAEQKWIANEAFRMQFADLSDEGIREALTRRGATPTDELVVSSRRLLDQVRDGTVTVGPQHAALVGLSAMAAAKVGEHFLDRVWIVCKTPSSLVTCDEPVVTVGGPGFPRDEHAGVANAGVILFPLSPERVLVMMRNDIAVDHGVGVYQQGQIASDELDHAETVEVSREVAMNSNRWSFERPSQAVVSLFDIPAAPEAAATQVIGPVSDGRRDGELVRVYRPTRWRNRPELLSPWPVQRWWRPAWRR